MKLSASLPEAEVAFLDTYARAHGHASRSAALLAAVRLLRESELGRDYADAWEQWGGSGDEDAWERATGDGVSAG